MKKQYRPFLTQFFSPILLKVLKNTLNQYSLGTSTYFSEKLIVPFLMQAFSITFFGEWGDKSQVNLLETLNYYPLFKFPSYSFNSILNLLQIATVGLAADENPLGVVLGGIL